MFASNTYIKGIIRNIQFSHESNNKQYDKALIEIDDSMYIPIKFRQDMLKLNNIQENDFVSTQGTIRTYSKHIYIHTNLSSVKVSDEQNCLCIIQGKIVKCDDRYNSYIVQCDKDTYIPVKSDNNYQLNTVINIIGHLIQRQYTKRGQLEKFITYEVIEG